MTLAEKKLTATVTTLVTVIRLMKSQKDKINSRRLIFIYKYTLDYNCYPGTNEKG